MSNIKLKEHLDFLLDTFRNSLNHYFSISVKSDVCCIHKLLARVSAVLYSGVPNEVCVSVL